MKRLAALILVWLITISGVAFSESQSGRTNDAVLFDEAIAELQHINDPDSVEEAYDFFQAITSNYNQAIRFRTYTEAVMNIYANQFDDAEIKLEMLSKSTEFTDFLQKYELPTCDVAMQYIKARRVEDNGSIDEAINIYTSIDFLDSLDRAIALTGDAKEIAYQNAVALYESKKYTEAAAAFKDLGSYRDSESRAAQASALMPLSLTPEKVSIGMASISAGYNHTVGLKRDGTVVAKGSDWKGCCDVSSWKDIITVSAGLGHTVGLKKDGTVVAVGDNLSGQCNVSTWKDIVSVSAGLMHTVGLKNDGTVVSIGEEYPDYDVSAWNDIIAVAAGFDFTIGLKKDGTVVAEGRNEYGQCDVGTWRDIVAIAASGRNSIGLKSDGTVVATGFNDYGECDVGSWTNIVAIATCWDGTYPDDSYNCTVGLKSDGTVVIAGRNDRHQYDVTSWENIVAISAGYEHIIGLKRDGTVVVVGEGYAGESDVAAWNDIRTGMDNP